MINRQVSRLRGRKRFLFTTGVAVAAAVAALATPALASTGTASTSAGYPPPGGIYKPFTNCPLNDPRMHETQAVGIGSGVTGGGGLAGCIQALAESGSITLGSITTPVTEAVHVQFGFNIPAGGPGLSSPSGSIAVYPPLAGPSAIIKTAPDVIPGTLTDALSCATATDATIQNMCAQIAQHPEDNQVTALAQQAGPISDFLLFSWTQPVKFKLINPLLGNNCYIGSNENPVLLKPQLSIGPGGGLTVAEDPEPSLHPNVAVGTITEASATSTGFDVPGVLGCGPGGAADVLVDEALDAWSGLPTTGTGSAGNSLSLNGTFRLTDNFNSELSEFPQPQDDAANVLAAFKASTNGGHSVKHLVGKAGFLSKLGLSGLNG